MRRIIEFGEDYGYDAEDMEDGYILFKYLGEPF